MKFDVIIRGGTVVDGTGTPGRQADLGIKGARIVAVAPGLVEEGRETAADVRVVDATGLVVCPGFIDTHTHSDLALLADPAHERAVRQGITTEITGQDGLSYAPLSPTNVTMYRRYLAGLNGNPSLPRAWSTAAEYLALFDGATSVNVAWQAPHGALRLETVGMVDRPLSGEALARAKDMLADAFEQGAVAFSTGLSYFPCSWADTEELVELCRVAAEYDRPFVIHLRTVFREPQRDYHLAAVEEALEIARRSGCKVHFSHFRTGPATAGQVDQLLAPILRAVEAGVDATMETYPYEYGSGFGLYYLPPWVHEGGPDEMMRRLADGAERARIRADMERMAFPPHPEETYTHLPVARYRVLEGLTFAEAGRQLGLHWLDAFLLLLLECNLEVGMKGVQAPTGDVAEQLERDFLQLIESPSYMVGSDSIPVGGKPHPRAYGAFPRFFALARKHGGPALETLIERMTRNAARRFGLKDRGVLAPGFAADVVVFDAKKMRDLATYEEPRQLAVGVQHVLVNGRFVLQEGA